MRNGENEKLKIKNGKWGDGRRDEWRIENVNARNGAGVFSGDKFVVFSGDPKGSVECGARELWEMWNRRCFVRQFQPFSMTRRVKPALHLLLRRLVALLPLASYLSLLCVSAFINSPGYIVTCARSERLESIAPLPEGRP